MNQLGADEATSNELLIEYYAKLNQLKQIKESIRKVQEKNE